MSEHEIPLKDATDAQLRTFAESHLGMSFPANTKAETMRARIASAWSKENITVPDDATEPQTTQGTRAATGTKAEKVKILVQRTDEPGGDEPVPVGVNGRVMLIPRGKPVEVPYTYFDVLSKAIKHVYDALPDGGINPVPREVPMYPFQRIQ